MFKVRSVATFKTSSNHRLRKSLHQQRGLAFSGKNHFLFAHGVRFEYFCLTQGVPQQDGIRNRHKPFMPVCADKINDTASDMLKSHFVIFYLGIVCLPDMASIAKDSQINGFIILKL